MTDDNVFVSGLPVDSTKSEIAKLFSSVGAIQVGR